MKFVCIASALNLRSSPQGTVIAELRSGDLFECDEKKSDSAWVSGQVISGISTGRKGFLRRKWIIQHYDSPPTLTQADRAQAASIVTSRTRQFDSVYYKLGDKAKSWNDLKKNNYIDCSGWVYLLAKEVIDACKLSITANMLYTYSDQQITNVGKMTGRIISGPWLTAEMFQPGCLIGIDFAEYSWDRDRSLDIDHIVMVSADANGRYVSQSSSSGGGVNRLPLDKALKSIEGLMAQGRVHLVDLFGK